MEADEQDEGDLSRGRTLRDALERPHPDALVPAGRELPAETVPEHIKRVVRLRRDRHKVGGEVL